MQCTLQESWYEKLNRWEEALKAYDAKREESPPGTIAHLEASMGRLRYSPGLASTCVWTFVGFPRLNAPNKYIVRPCDVT